MRIAFFLLGKGQKETISSRLGDHDLKFYSEPLNEGNIEDVKDSEILISRFSGLSLKFNKEVLEKFPNLKFISTMSTGFDHIDLDYCKNKGVVVSNVPSYSESSVAEQSFALILSILKKVPKSIKTVESGSFTGKDLECSELHEKVLGVIGSGKIGLKVIKIAKGFGMKVLAYDVIKNNGAASELGFEYAELGKLLAESDVVSVHVPYNKHTYHLLNKENLKDIKQGSIIINSARGEIIDTEALLENLENKRISCAGLDVVENEGLELFDDPHFQKLVGLENVFITPHNSANTKEAKKRMLDKTIENIQAFVNGSPKNIV